MDKKQLDDAAEKVAQTYFNLNKHHPNPNLKPVGYVLGGQPGAGKSHLINKIIKSHHQSVMVINADNFRYSHPDYDRLQKDYGKESVAHTSEFAGLVTEKLINKAVEARKSIIIEGTFRTAETPINTLKKLKAAQYRTEVNILSTDKNTSWESTLERYNKAMAANPHFARATPKEHHDLVVKNLADNAEKVYQSGLVDRFTVNTRNGIVFDSKNYIFSVTSLKTTINNVLNDSKLKAIANPSTAEENAVMLQKKALQDKGYDTNFLKINPAEINATYQGYVLHNKDQTLIINKDKGLIAFDQTKLPQNFARTAKPGDKVIIHNYGSPKVRVKNETVEAKVKAGPKQE